MPILVHHTEKQPLQKNLYTSKLRQQNDSKDLTIYWALNDLFSFCCCCCIAPPIQSAVFLGSHWHVHSCCGSCFVFSRSLRGQSSPYGRQTTNRDEDFLLSLWLFPFKKIYTSIQRKINYYNAQRNIMRCLSDLASLASLCCFECASCTENGLQSVDTSHILLIKNANRGWCFQQWQNGSK